MSPNNQGFPFQESAPPACIVVSVEFGQRLPNGNCGHIGICSTGDACLPGEAPLARNSRCRHAIAYVSVGSNGHAIFFFPRDKMLPCTVRAFFRGPTFRMPGTYELPGAWHTDLPLLLDNTVAPGLYPIEKYTAGFLIRF